MKQTNPRAGHGYCVPVGVFDTVLFAIFFNPTLAVGVLITIICAVIFLRYLWKHLRWEK